MRLCVDCTHVILPTWQEPWHRCSHPESRAQSPVTGAWTDQSAEAMRSSGPCGADGRLYVWKEKSE